MPLDPFDRLSHPGVVRQSRAGDARKRHIIDEAGSVFEHLGKPPVVGRGRGEADEIQARVARRDAQLGVLLGRQVDDNQPVDARSPGVGQKPFDSIDIDRVVIAHQNDGRRLVARAEVLDELERLPERRSAFERPKPRCLDRRAVGHRVGEGHADLDHVGPGGGQGLQDVERGRKVRVARHHKGHESGPPLGLQGGKTGVDTGGHAAPESFGFCRLNAFIFRPKP